MAQALPLILAALAGFALIFVLTALWQSMRMVLQGGTAQQRESARASAADVGTAHSVRAQARAALLREKSTLLQAIRDMRFEHDLGKISDVDLERLDAQYRVRARAVLAELDAQIEPYRAKARALLGVDEAGTQLAATESAEPAAATAVTTPNTAACPACETFNDTDAVFCKKCGARMTSEAGS